MDGCHSTLYSGADHQLSISNARNVHRQSSTLSSIPVPSLPRWLVSGSTHNIASHFQYDLQRGPSLLLILQLLCNKTGFPYRRTRLLQTEAGWKSLLKKQSRPMQKFWTAYKRTTSCFPWSTKHYCTELPLSPLQTWKVSAYTPQMKNKLVPYSQE